MTGRRRTPVVTAGQLVFILIVASGSLESENVVVNAIKPGNPQSAYFKACPKAHQVREGSFVVLNCRQSETSGVYYLWSATKNNLLIYPSSRHEFGSTARRMYKANGPNGDLTIRKADRFDDNRTFYCVAHMKNSEMQSCPPVQLTVQYIEPEVIVQRIQPAGDDFLRVGDILKLKCQVDSSPLPQIFWFHNGERLKSGSGISNRIYTRNNILTLDGLKITATGTYTCMAKHLNGEILANIPYTLLLTDSALPNFQVARGGGSVVYLKPGSSKVLKCSSDARDVQIKWFYGESITRVQHSSVVLSKLDTQGLYSERWGDNRSDLKILSYSRPGFYLCQIDVNGDGRLAVQFLYRVVTAEINPLHWKENFEPPLKPAKPLVVQEGTNFVLRVYADFAMDVVSGIKFAPIPTMTWIAPNGEKISTVESNGMKISRNRFLNFTSIKRYHSGTYTLKLQNEAGVRRNMANIVVAFKPSISIKMNHEEVQETEDVEFDCKVQPSGMNVFPVSRIVWFREDTRLDSKVNARYVTNSSSTKFKIKGAIPSDKGRYRCRVITTFEFGNGEDKEMKADSNYFVLTVRKKLKFLHENTHGGFMRLNTQGIIWCKAEGRGNLRYKYMKKSSNGFVELKADPIVHSPEKYVIPYVREEDSGMYKCVVRDENNEEITSYFAVHVGVTSRGELVDTDNATVSKGADHLLHCKGEGYFIKDNVEKKTKIKARVSWIFRYANQVYQSTVISLPHYGIQNWVPSVQKLRSNIEINQNLRNIVLFKNGTLKINNMSANNNGVYQCLVATNYSMAYTDKIYISLNQPPTKTPTEQPSLSRTILIVVGCAAVYLSLVIALIVYCSFKIWKRKNRRSEQLCTQMLEVNAENRKLENGSVPAESHRLINGVGKKGDGLEVEFTVIPNSGSGSGTAPPDARSYMSGLSGGSSGLVYGMSLAAGTPANSTVESTVERICRNYQVNRHALAVHKGVLGRGLFGQVKMATATQFNHPVTNDSLVMVKYLTSRDHNHSMEFINQLKMFAKCDHDFVTKLLGVCTEEGEPPVMILEYCEHGNLFEFLRSMRDKYGPRSIREDNQLRMCLQVAQAMEHLHSLGHHHRDLAAHNIIVTRELNLKLTDLGPCLDRFVGHYYGPLRKHQLLPIRWLPPEVVSKDYWTPQTDVWSYGIVVTEIFSYGQLPYAKMTDYSVLEAANRGSLMPEEPAGCPPELQELLQRCWEDDPSQRPTFSQLCLDVGDLTRDSADL